MVLYSMEPDERMSVCLLLMRQRVNYNQSGRNHGINLEFICIMHGLMCGLCGQVPF